VKVLEHKVEHLVRLEPGPPLGLQAQATEVDQIVQQVLHLSGGRNRQRQVFAAPLVQSLAIVPRQQTAE